MHAPPATAPSPPAWAAVGVAWVGACFGGLSAQLNSLALPDIGGSLGVSADDASWLLTVQVMAEALAIPMVARTAFTLGMRRLAVGAGLLFALAACGGYASQGLPALLAWRALQGLAGGCFAVMMMVAVMASLPPGPLRLAGLALYGFTLSLPALIGPAALAPWLSAGSWRELLLFDAAWAIGYALLASSRLARQPAQWSAWRATDWLGYVLLAGGTAFLMLALTQGERRFWLESTWIAGSLLGATLLLAGALWRLNRPGALLDLSLLRLESFAIALLLSLFLRLGLLVAAWLLPQQWMRLNGLRPEQWTLPLLAMGLLLPLAFAAATQVAARIDVRWMLFAGLLTFAAGAAWASGIEPRGSLLALLPVLLASALAQALFVVALLVIATDGVRKEQGPTAATLFNLARLVGQWGFTALLATQLAERQKAHSARLVDQAASGRIEVSERLQQLTLAPSDPVLAAEQALRSMAQQFSQQAWALAFSDTLLLAATMLLGGLLLISLIPDLRKRS